MQQPASDEPKQTTPKGYEIPVPTKERVMRFFEICKWMTDRWGPM